MTPRYPAAARKRDPVAAQAQNASGGPPLLVRGPDCRLSTEARCPRRGSCLPANPSTPTPAAVLVRSSGSVGRSRRRRVVEAQPLFSAPAHQRGGRRGTDPCVVGAASPHPRDGGSAWGRDEPATRAPSRAAAPHPVRLQSRVACMACMARGDRGGLGGGDTRCCHPTIAWPSVGWVCQPWRWPAAPPSLCCF